MISNDIKYVGVNDKGIDLFESQFIVPDGMAYNSYVILDEKIAVIDSVEIGFKDEWISNIKSIIGNRDVDYLVVQHLEPDHSSSIVHFIKEYPKAKIVSSQRGFDMIRSFYKEELTDRRVVIGEGTELSLGEHNLRFYTAPMVHWPEVFVTYDERDKVLFSADAFGKFGALDSNEEWIDEARRYYFGIVGKYGAQVSALLKKLSALEIKAICSLHGPVLDKNLEYYIGLYHKWSKYEPEKEGVVINYTSVYGNTKKAVMLLKDELLKNGCDSVEINDLARCDMMKAVADSFKYSKVVFATTTYNMHLFPFMQELLRHLRERNFQNRTVAFIENGSWAPVANKLMRSELEGCKELKYLSTDARILSSLDEESINQIKMIAKEL